MTNINDFDPRLLLTNEITTSDSRQLCLRLVILKKITHHILL